MDRIKFVSPGMDVSLDAVLSYASDHGIACFATDGHDGGEYRVEYSNRGRVYRHTGRLIAGTRDSRHRARIQAPFRPFGHFAFRESEGVTSIFRCLDLLKAGYVFGHVPTPRGPKKIWLIAQLARNCFSRLGVGPRRKSMRSALRRMTEYSGLTYRPEPGRILMITSTYNNGGSERQLVTTASGLIERGYDVRILALGVLDPAVPDVQAELRKLGITPLLPSDFLLQPAGYRVPSDRTVGFSVEGLPPIVVQRLGSVLAAIRELRPRVVHGWVDVPAVIGAVAACHLGVPRIVVGLRSAAESMTINEYPRELRTFVWEGLHSVRTKPAVAVLANSLAGTASYERWLGVPRETIRTVKNGYTTGRVSQPSPDAVRHFRAQCGWPAEVPVVGTVMRFVAQKDPDLWLDTAAEIAKKRPEVRFLIAGFGELQAAMNARVAALGLADRVVMPGAPVDVGLVYASLDVVLLTSVLEGTPNVLIEAQVAGRPIVTVDVGGTTEAISIGRTSRVVPGRSAQDLAAAVIDILDDPTWAARARTEGPDFVASTFGADRMIRETRRELQPRIGGSKNAAGYARLDSLPVDRKCRRSNVTELGGSNSLWTLYSTSF
jgi:glycosyltransferase involved in cell wall biosynthesis